MIYNLVLIVCYMTLATPGWICSNVLAGKTFPDKVSCLKWGAKNATRLIHSYVPKDKPVYRVKGQYGCVASRKFRRVDQE